MSAFDMGPAVRPSGLIKTTRWSLLLVGIWYGHRRYVTANIIIHVSSFLNHIVEDLKGLTDDIHYMPFPIFQI